MGKIKKCVNCNNYTLEDSCPNCSGDTREAKPPKFSFPDKYSKYRRRFKEDDKNG